MRSLSIYIFYTHPKFRNKARDRGAPMRRTTVLLRMATAGPARTRNHYEVLGVERTATAAEIKQAFYALSKRVGF